MAQIIDGKKLAAGIREEIKAEAAQLPRRPGLAVILAGEDPASLLYVNNKVKDCAECGFLSRRFRRFNLSADASEEELLGIINKLNRDGSIDGILVQLPLPEHMDERRIIESISPEKDVDAFHPLNVGRMVRGDSPVWPCTPAGISEMLHAYDISVDGRICCHRHTPDLAAMTRQADILVVAAGCKGLIRADMVKEGAVVIDVAMNRDAETGKFSGDVAFDEVEPKAAYITPVPGGVGPMTRAMLMKNTLTLAKIHMGLLEG